jgi:glyoxylase-like metal-dependent hydrolase (beta-lactamase superfamily II)
MIKKGEPMRKLLAVQLSAMLALTSQAFAHDVPDDPPAGEMNAVMEAMGWKYDEAKITTEVLAEGFYVLFGMGGNILVSSGKDGVLIVDDQFPELMPKLRKAMRKQGDKQVDFVINTHWHFDHAQGNLALGPDGAWIVSHANSRDMMQGRHVINLVGAALVQEPYPASALPDITYDTTMQFFLNGERVDLLHTGPAHTTGDTAVIFRGRNAVHLGDVYNNSGYPFIDADNGGSLDGVIAFCEAVLAEIDGDTMVVPGHGPVASRDDLQAYVYMLKTIRGELVAMIREGRSLAEIQAAGITATWDEKMGDPANFINRSYTSLTRRYLN